MGSIAPENRTHTSINGHLTDDGTREFHYDYRNQLVKVTEGETVLAEYEYDALGRRTKKTVDADVTRYYHDGVHEIVEVDGSGALLRRYVYRDDIDSIAMMEAVDQADVDDDASTSELVRLYFHVDPRTNVAFLTDASEDVVESYEYDPYGNITIRDQAGDPVATSPAGNPFTFQRRRLDAETGLYYFRARHYDAEAGQWMQRDPLGYDAGANWRLFESAAPTQRLDPFGTDDWESGDAARHVGLFATTAGGVVGLEASALAAFLFPSESQQGGPRDMFRHCWWSCRMTRKCGADAAEFLGANHEEHGVHKRGSNGKPHPGMQADLYNNLIGRMCAYSTGSCKDCCLKQIEAGNTSGGGYPPPDTGGGTPTPPPDGGGGTPTPPPDGGSGTPTPPPSPPTGPTGGSQVRGSWRDRATRVIHTALRWLGW